MKKLLSFLLATVSLSAFAKGISSQEYAQQFKNYNACFILYSVNEHKIISEYNPENRCSERISPNSTFKIPLSLMAFNQGIINQKTVFKWHGEKGVIPEHEQDQTANSWLKYSVVWVSQQLTPRLGYARIKHYLASFDYGNQDFSGDPGKNNGLTFAWLSSSLKISAVEQLNFLKAMLTNELAINNKAVADTKKNLYQGKLANGADYYGKTGSGRHGHNEREANPSKLREGWFVGFIEKGTQQYIFVSNLSDKNPPAPNDKSYGSALLKPITLKLLNDYFSG
ncbi:penicillin-binding transpeptidase domain-containing protein [Legionella cardiaca]|uniref:Beta-lactamase n=1 Tax=Legionella cardiaca TaxID=1071983 RepID=A0ABY8AU52_9GAMM|nr:penicillin-binding transpeptidase domain-containing protein [Legionella cardiaca]WED42672.1 penicillin-binding transpeptidase domain-containing protein [Legionella cardiaca]